MHPSQPSPSTPSLDYYILDVFTSNRLEGNALAVVLNPGSLTTPQMQAIARETNLSETTFVERRSAEIESREGIRVRIFTTQEELAFAGHPTLGTASLLKVIDPDVIQDGVVTLELKAGRVPVRFSGPAAVNQPWPIRGEMTQIDPTFGETLDADEVASLSGLNRDDFHPSAPIQIVSTGTAFAIVPLVSATALRNLSVRQHDASAYLKPRGARWFYFLGPDSESLPSGATSPPLTWRARMQFHGGEDPATGSAAGCAISHLVYHQVVPPATTIRLRQGVEIHRPSELFLTACLVRDSVGTGSATFVTDVRVGGSTILVAKGELFLP